MGGVIPSPFRVRLARPQDLGPLFELRKAAVNAQMFPGTDPEFLVRTLTSPMGGRVLVAEDDKGRVLGYAALAEAPEPTCGLLEIMVGRFERRHGVGRSLADAADALARLHGLARLEVHTSADNGLGDGFLRAVGYRPAGEAPGSHGGVAYRRSLRS